MTRIGHKLRAYGALARWLGPWAASDHKPRRVIRRSVPVAPERAGDRPFHAWVYQPARAPIIGTYLLAPGLQFDGPSDRRMDRFSSILASAGLLVFAPFLPDYTALRVAPGALRDIERSLAALVRDPAFPRGSRPAVFSISFGSLLALRLAASDDHAAHIRALVVFGGYADWRQAIQFCVTGESNGVRRAAYDPLNQPVVLMNLIDHIPGAPADPAPLLAAWRRFVGKTWGRPEMKRRDRYVALAQTIAADVPDDARRLFLIGCGIEPGAWELCREALDRDERRSFLDPRPYLTGLRCPVHLIHGIDDDVIPHNQLDELARAMPAHVAVKTYLTGLYGHTGTSGLALAHALPRAAGELWTMARILRVLVGAAAG